MISLLSMLALLCILIFSLQFSSVQTLLTKQAARYISKQLGGKVEIGSIYFKPFSALSLREFKLSDPNGVEILSARKLDADLVLTEFFQNKVVIEQITLEQAYVDFQVYKDSSNIKFLIDYFRPKKKEDQPSKKKMELRLDALKLVDNHIKILNHTQKHHSRGIDFSDIELTALSGEFSKIDYDSTALRTSIKSLRFREKSGFHLKELSANTRIAKKEMEFKDLHILTNNSTVGNYLKFSYTDFGAFSDFVKKVQMQASMQDVFVDSRDIEYFAPDMKFVKFKAQAHSGEVSGTVANMVVRNAAIETGQETSLMGDFTIKGLPNINKTIFDFKARELRTSANDVEMLVPQLANRKDFSLPEQLHKLGTIHFQGSLQGLYNLFDVDGKFETQLGDLTTTSKIDIQQGIAYSGVARSKEFQIGELLNNTSFRNTAFDLDFDGRNLVLQDLKLSLIGNLRNFYFSNYQYDSIAVDAVLQDQQIDAQGQISDPNIRLDYLATVNLQGSQSTYEVDAQIEKVNLKRMGFVNQDSILIYNSTISTRLAGNNLNNLTGDLLADQISMETSKGNFIIDDLYFAAEGNQTDRFLTLKSNVLDAEMRGIIDLNTIVPYFKALAMRYAPAIGLDIEPYNPQLFDLKLDIKSFEPLSAFLDPTLTLEDGANLEAHFSSEDYTAAFKAFSPFVKYQGINLENLSIEEMADENAFTLNLKADRLLLSDSVFVNNIEINNILAQDSLLFTIKGAEETDLNHLRLGGNIHFAHNKPAYIKFNESTIVVNDEPWSFNTDAEMRVSKGKFYLNKLIASQGNQQVEFNGVLSNEDDKLDVRFSRFNLHSIESVTKPMGIHLDGELNGNIEIHSIFKKPYLSANVHTTPLVYNQIPIGQLVLLADFDPETKMANLDFQLLDDMKRGLTLQGTYRLESANQSINLKGKLNQMELILLQPFVRSLASDLTGKMDADLEIGGTLGNPQINGLAKIETASFNVNYLKTSYSLNNQSVLLDKNTIMLNNLTFADSKGNQAVAGGLVDLSKLSNPYIDVEVASNNVMILNTTYKDNNLYYGTAYATGTYKFKGLTSAIDINIKARSEDNTSITIPFNTAMTVSESDFIYFVSQDSSENKKNESRYFFKGMTMNMDLELTPSAEVNLQTDIGSLKGNGSGEISLKISSLGDFEMFGDYSINSGKFHFTAQDFINKYFDIKQGGTIRWTGAPAGATVNMTAVYQQRTSITDLYNAAGRAGQNERVLAQADMIIKGTLSQPDVSFDLNFPQTPYVKDELQSYLSDANNVNQQALSLIIRRSFTANSTNEFGREVNNTLLSAGTEIAFNQLNNILAQSLNINFLDFNIRSLNDASASVRFFNDRLVLTGGIVDRRNIQTTDLTFFSNQVATDAELTYKIRRDGSLMFRAYNRLNTRNILFTPTDDYINALGLVYRTEFNTLGEFWKKMWTWKPKKDSLLVLPSIQQDTVKKVDQPR
ncbi:translocation/assembly module TamB domain-containing protein [Sphingobacterium lactis]|uniref:translocation/assembly module TamB domain-containing protein n=1 Tax=Sphingobacterium lactis TaxID=797291 RepID=UPI001F17C393|nr:translocation/assembly module TamB domain-containing protein [Sphingobacterium lactis]